MKYEIDIPDSPYCDLCILMRYGSFSNSCQLLKKNLKSIMVKIPDLPGYAEAIAKDKDCPYYAIPKQNKEEK